MPNSLLLNLGCGAHFHSDWDNYDFIPSPPAVKQVDLNRSLPFSEAAYKVCYMSHVLEHLPRQRTPVLLSEIFRILKPGGVLRVVVPDLETIARLYLAELEAAAAGDPVAADRHEWMTLEMLDQMTRSFPGGFMGRSLRVRPLPISNFIVQRFGSEAKKWLDASDASVAQLKREEVYQVGAVAAAAECSFRQSGEVHRWMYDRVSLGALLKQSGFEGIRVCRAAESSIKEFGHYRLDTDDDGSVRKPDSLFMEAIKPGTPN